MSDERLVGQISAARYRGRTRLRRNLPAWLGWLAPKGKQPCGDHEWYRETDTDFRCYHCESMMWVNAVVEFTVPLEVAVDADGFVKQAALGRLMDHFYTPSDAVGSARAEIVVDGEPTR